MTCRAACLCRCGQTGCSCHVTAAIPTGSLATKQEPAQNARCQMCSGGASSYFVRSPLGRVVTVLWCGTCDVAEPK